MLEERFEHLETIRARWIIVAPDATDYKVRVEDTAAQLVLAAGDEFSLRHRFDVAALRGQRLRLSAHIRAASSAVGKLTFLQSEPHPRYSGITSSSAVKDDSWHIAEAVVDITPDCLQAELALNVSGSGSAWFKDVLVESLGPSPPPQRATLSPKQLTEIVALSRAATFIRYRHPSDQAANLDWNTFLPAAVHRVMAASGSDSLAAILRELFAPIAPTVVFGTKQPATSAPQRSTATHLARWRHLGFGTEAPYMTWREGRDPDLASLQLRTPLEGVTVARCKTAHLTALGRSAGPGKAAVVVDVELPGRKHHQVERKLEDRRQEVTMDIDVPPDAYRVQVGVNLTGEASLELESLSVHCQDGPAIQIDLARTTWRQEGWRSLYTVRLDGCATSSCLAIARIPPDSTFTPARDVLPVELGEGLWMHMPLAVWADDHRTHPSVESSHHGARFGTLDLETRLASVMTTWGVALLFYPYLSDQKIDWSRELGSGLLDAASAGSAEELHGALWRLVAKLHDNHATIVHPARPIDGILPVALRRFSDKLIIVGAVHEFARDLPVGAEVIAIDSIPAMQAYDSRRAQISAATSAWTEAITPFWLTLGPAGTFAAVRVQTASGAEHDVLLPHLPRATFDSVVREARPPSGSEPSPAVYYVDLEAIKAEHWQAVLPAMQKAKAIIFDLRGVPSRAAFPILGHFIDRPIYSPWWQEPVLESGDYQTSRWEIRPAAPRLHAHVVVLIDGRVMSIGETVLQIIHDYHLATLIGEPSGGTNGNICSTVLPGGFVMRFTGMRVPLQDGTAIQGSGIVPQQLVRPTLEGVRAGRDEILEAAVAFATLLPP